MEHVDEKILSVLEAQQREQEKKELRNTQLHDVIKEIKQGLIVESGTEMEQKHFFGKKLALYMPKYFHEMTAAHIKVKYPNENRPKLLYTNDMDSINIGINMIEDEEEFTSDDVIDFRDIMLDSFMSTSPSSKVYDKGEITIGEDTENERLIAYYCFNSFAMGGAMYNLIFNTLLDGAMAIVSINCSIKDKPANELMFYGIMHTTVVNI